MSRLTKEDLKPGTIVGNFTVIEPALKIQGWNVNRWKCRCVCGNERTYSTTQLKKATTCGCARKKRMSKIRRHPSEKANVYLRNAVYSRYITSASKRNLEFSLSREQVSILTSQECFYCGRSPMNTIKSNGYAYKYNGIDRIDNNNGYTFDNVVPCCRICNSTKGTLTLPEFINHIVILFSSIPKFTDKLKTTQAFMVGSTDDVSFLNEYASHKELSDV